MFFKLLIRLCRLFPSSQNRLWRRVYGFLAARFPVAYWTFMNYGYAPLDDRERPPRLEEADESDRYAIQLYHHVAGAACLEGLRVLEVGSGRGGGASYVRRYLKPGAMIGVDFSQRAVAFSRSRHRVEGLSFVAGDAEGLPFRDGHFDAVINVESSHCYDSVDGFLSQVRRVLRPGGVFLFADLRRAERLALLRDQVRRSGLELVRETDITRNVLEALNRDSDRRTSLIREGVSRLWRKSFLQFAGVKGSRNYENLRSGRLIYTSFVLKKPVH